MVCCKTLPQLGICPCCFGDDEEDYDGGYRTRDRYCTDLYVLIIYILALIGLGIVVGVGYQDGDVRRLVRGTDYLGNLCGEDNPVDVDPDLFDSSGSNWTARKYLWYPWSPNLDFFDPTGSSLFSLLDNGVCVEKCPSFSLGIKFPDPRDFWKFHPDDVYQLAQLETVQGYNLPATGGSPIKHYVWYDSTPAETFRRCIPTAIMNSSYKLAAGLSERSAAVGKVLEINGFIERGLTELSNAWKACAVMVPIAFVIGAVWLFLMRFLTKPIVFTVLLGTLVLMVMAGFVCWWRYEELARMRDSTDPTLAVNVVKGADGKNDATGYWWHIAIALWVLSFVYILLLVFMLRRVLIAIDIMEEAVVLVATSPLLFLIPIVKTVTIGLLLAGHAYAAMLLYTIQDDAQFLPRIVETYSPEIFAKTNIIGENCRSLSALANAHVAPAFNPVGFVPVPLTGPVPGDHPAPGDLLLSTTTPVPSIGPLGATLTATPLAAVPGPLTAAELDDLCNATRYIEKATMLIRDVSGSDMRWYGGWWNFFMLLWNVAFFNAFSYFIIAMFVCAWYFSAKEDNAKSSSVIIAWLKTIRYHLGTIAFGSLIIAGVQLIRWILTFFESKLETMRRQLTAAEFMMKCIKCILWCIEKIMIFVNANAYIMTAIRGSSFCTSIYTSLTIIFTNFLLVAAISFITTAILIITKVAIVLSCLLIGWWIVSSSPLVVASEFRVFPLVLIGITSYIIASIWVNIVDTSVQSLRVCFMWDEANTQQYSPSDLKRWMAKHSYSNKVAPAKDDVTEPENVKLE